MIAQSLLPSVVMSSLLINLHYFIAVVSTQIKREDRKPNPKTDAKLKRSKPKLTESRKPKRYPKFKSFGVGTCLSIVPVGNRYWFHL
jgi:hypothetical protein